jgi:hypothetical protein
MDEKTETQKGKCYAQGHRPGKGRERTQNQIDLSTKPVFLTISVEGNWKGKKVEVDRHTSGNSPGQRQRKY